MKKLTIAMLCVTTLIACTHRGYEKSGQGIVVSNEKQAVWLQVMRPDIIRVFASPSTDIPERGSKIISGDFEPEGDWDVKEDTASVTLSTGVLHAIVNKKTLEVRFTNAAGEKLLQEKKRGGKSFEPLALEGDSAWTICQQFETGDEALYGMGQHQDRSLNIKGQQINLFQRNRQIYLPLMVSTKGYGLLWDNYSWTRFGSLEPSRTIPASCWADKTGKTGGLSVTYFSDSNLKKRIPVPGLSQVCPFELPEAGKDQILSVRLEGTLHVPESGDYQFENTGQQCFRLWINGVLVRDYWSSFLQETDYTRLTLEKDVPYKVKIEWSRNNPSEQMTLAWRVPSMTDPYISFWSKAGRGIDYYFIYGPSMDQVISGYRKLTGDVPLMPRWAYGFWQSKERYKTQDELLSVVKEFRKRKVPLDVIVQDWLYWIPGTWGSHEFDSTRFPDPAAMTDSIHRMNARVMISVWAKFEKGTEHYNDLLEAGYLYPFNIKDSTCDSYGRIYAYYDAYNPGARKMYWEQIRKRLLHAGIDAWWLDATEPEVAVNITPEDMARRMQPNYFGTGTEYLNLFPLYTCKGIYENQRAEKPEQRVCILTRSAFAGQQHYAAASWSGDIVGRWEVLRAQIAAGLSFCVSGIPYWTTDIGGFFVGYPGGSANEEYRELFTRWYQFGTFCPVFRVHGTDTPREIWNFGRENTIYYSTQLRFDKLRYRLLPYIYTVASEVNRNDYTMMRPLVMDFTQDRNVWDIDDQFMFGPSMLVNPVTLYGVRSRAIYLPQGYGWYDFWSGIFFQGGQSIQVPAPPESIPLFIKAGSIIPLGPELQYTSEKPADPIRLMIYAGADGRFDLYEDEGVNYHYEHGEYSLIPIAWNEKKSILSIGDRSGNFKGMLRERIFEITLIKPDRLAGYDPLPVPDTTVRYSGEAIRLTLKERQSGR